MAELMETPFMLVVTILAARWIVRRLAVPPTPYSRLAMGGFALGLLLIAEFTLVLWLRGLSISGYLASRDPVSGTVYYVMLGVFAIMPRLVARRRDCPSARVLPLRCKRNRKLGERQGCLSRSDLPNHPGT
jgi:hypothetical protein